tara:strand:- start:125 stop:514 length:390 start_codon:yes stop_codon:yes gene_type:complete
MRLAELITSAMVLVGFVRFEERHFNKILLRLKEENMLPEWVKWHTIETLWGPKIVDIESLFICLLEYSLVSYNYTTNEVQLEFGENMATSLLMEDEKGCPPKQAVVLGRRTKELYEEVRKEPEIEIYTS